MNVSQELLSRLIDIATAGGVTNELITTVDGKLRLNFTSIRLRRLSPCVAIIEFFFHGEKIAEIPVTSNFLVGESISVDNILGSMELQIAKD